MTKTTTTRTFNKAHQQAGAPYQCHNGFEAKILEWVGESAIGYFNTASGEAFGAQWSSEGVENNSYMHNGAHNLVMTPLGHIEGRPVFVGDKYLGFHDVECEAQAITAGGDWSGCRWPDSAPVIQTKMTAADFCKLGNGIGENTNMHQCQIIANAAIARAVADGQVVTKEAHEAALLRLGDRLSTACDQLKRQFCTAEKALTDAGFVFSPDANPNWMAPADFGRTHEGRHIRDMAVAMAVRSETVKELAKVSGLGPIRSLYEPTSKAWLQTIIAKVP